MKHTLPSPEEAARYAITNPQAKTGWANRHRFRMVTCFLPSITTSEKLLDFGCGNCLFLRYLSENNFQRQQLTGYDPYYIADEINALGGSLGVEIHRCLEEINFVQFDFVTALDVIEHIEDDRKALMQINSLLKPSGTLIIIVPAYQFTYSLWDARVGHYRRYTRRSIVNLLEDSGFSVLHSTYFFTFLIPAAIIRKYYLQLRRTWCDDHLLSVPVALHEVFSTLANAEFKLLHKTEFNLPCGTSIFVVARKKTI